MLTRRCNDPDDHEKNSSRRYGFRNRVLGFCRVPRALWAGFVVGAMLPAIPAKTMAQTASPTATPEPIRYTVATSFDFSQGVVLLDIDLGGTRPAHMVLDTGYNRSVLDTEAAKELGITLEESARQTAGSGAEALTYYRITPSRFRLAGTELLVKPLLVMSNRKSYLENGVTCDGTVGYDCLKQMAVQIDYPARQLRLLDATDSKATAARGSVFPITWKKYHSRSPELVTIEDFRVGGHPLCAQLDTFFTHTAILFSTKLPWLKSETAPGVASVRYEEAQLAAVRVPDGVALGTYRLDASAPVFLAGADAHVPETEIAAVLGNGFFASRVLTLDFPTSRLVLEDKLPSP